MRQIWTHYCFNLKGKLCWLCDRWNCCLRWIWNVLSFHEWPLNTSSLELLEIMPLVNCFCRPEKFTDVFCIICESVREMFNRLLDSLIVSFMSWKLLHYGSFSGRNTFAVERDELKRNNNSPHNNSPETWPTLDMWSETVEFLSASVLASLRSPELVYWEPQSPGRNTPKARSVSMWDEPWQPAAGLGFGASCVYTWPQ